MDLSDKTLRVARANKWVHKDGYRYPVEKKIEVATKWLALGNMRLVADLTKVDYDLCRKWKTQPWWPELVDEIKASRTRQLDDKLSRIVDKSLEAIEDRLEHGDVIFNQKTGLVERKEVSLKDATKVATDLLTRQAVLQKLEDEKVVHQEAKSVKEQLAMLALEFAKFNKTNTGPVVDAVIVGETNAIHEEREEGLQEGSGGVYVEAGSEEEESDAECSSSGDGESWEGS
jgi:hypothetical protein